MSRQTVLTPKKYIETNVWRSKGSNMVQSLNSTHNHNQGISPFEFWNLAPQFDKVSTTHLSRLCGIDATMISLPMKPWRAISILHTFVTKLLMLAAKGWCPTIIQKPPSSSMMFHHVLSRCGISTSIKNIATFSAIKTARYRSTTMPSLCGWHVLRLIGGTAKDRKTISDPFARCSITFSWSLVCMCIIPLFRPQAMQFWTCGMHFRPGLQKDWVSGTAINTKPETHQCFVVRLVRPWLGMQFQGLDPPPLPQIRGDSIGLRISRWFPRQALPCTCASFCSELLTNDILKPLALGYQ